MEVLAYRVNVLLLFLSQGFSLLVFVVLWQAIYSQNNQVGDYSLHQLIVYYSLSSFLGFVVWGVDVAWRVGDEINLGLITSYILRPVNYFWLTFSAVLAKVIFNLILVGLLVLGLYFFWPEGIGDLFSHGERNLFFALAVFFSFCLFFTFFFWVGILAFWLGVIAGFNFFIRTVMVFLSGALVPLNLLPEALIQINRFLPFQYITWFPIQIFLGKIPLEAKIFLPVIGWIGFFWLLGFFTFKKGLKKYEGFGA